MPKKFQGENSKAVVARARKDADKAEAARKKAEAEEEEAWRDDDKHAMRKQNRKVEKEAKMAERQERKAELRQMHDLEMESAAARPAPSEKVTRAEIEARRQLAAAGGNRRGSGESEPKLEENLNRLVIDGEEARNVDEALEVLAAGPAGADRHPERRMRAAYRAYEERELERLKKELPAMRMSQLKQLVHKNWEKSNENPMNQRHTAYNEK